MRKPLLFASFLTLLDADLSMTEALPQPFALMTRGFCCDRKYLSNWNH